MHVPLLDREEYIEQAYLFGTLRERLKLNHSTQELLAGMREELLATAKLPMAVDFMLSELKLKGVMASAMARLSHYFTPFQTYIMSCAEDDRQRFDFSIALDILAREALYRASDSFTTQGIFLFQFECVCRIRLGYDRSLEAMSQDSTFPSAWRDWIMHVRQQVGLVEIGDLIYFRSQHYLDNLRQGHPDDPHPEDFPADESTTSEPLFGEREGKIAWANRGKDPLFLFAALERQLGYPSVPRPQVPEKDTVNLHQMQKRLEQLELRLRMMEEEARGGINLDQLVAQQKQEEKKLSLEPPR